MPHATIFHHEDSQCRTLFAGGNARLVEALADGLPIVYNSVVDRVQYAGNGVKVHAGGRIYEGENVPCYGFLLIMPAAISSTPLALLMYVRVCAMTTFVCGQAMRRL